MICHILFLFTSCTSNNSIAFDLGNDLQSISIGLSMLNCVRSSILTNSVEIFAAYAYLFCCKYIFTFWFFKSLIAKSAKWAQENFIPWRFIVPKWTWRDAGHFFPFRNCPGQSGTSGLPTLTCRGECILPCMYNDFCNTECGLQLE